MELRANEHIGNTAHWILVPIDFSSDSQRALECADREARDMGAGLILLHVKRPSERLRGHFVGKQGAIEKWGRYVRYTPKKRVAYMTCVGNAAEEILRVAQQYRLRAIVMGRGGRAALPGSVAARVEHAFDGRVDLVCGPASGALTA